MSAPWMVTLASGLLGLALFVGLSRDHRAGAGGAEWPGTRAGPKPVLPSKAGLGRRGGRTATPLDLQEVLSRLESAAELATRAASEEAGREALETARALIEQLPAGRAAELVALLEGLLEEGRRSSASQFRAHLYQRWAFDDPAAARAAVLERGKGWVANDGKPVLLFEGPVYQLYRAVFAGWARRDALAAWRQWDFESSDGSVVQFDEIEMIETLFRSLATQDPEEAWSVLLEDAATDPSLEVKFIAFCEEVEQHDWSHAAELIDRQEREWDRARHALALRWLETDPSDALNWYCGYPDRDRAGEIGGRAAWAWSRRQPREAVAWVRAELARGRVDTAKGFLARGTGSSTLEFARHLLGGAAGAPRRELMRWLAHNDDSGEEGAGWPVTSVHSLLAEVPVDAEVRDEIEAVLRWRDREERQLEAEFNQLNPQIQWRTIPVR